MLLVGCTKGDGKDDTFTDLELASVSAEDIRSRAVIDGTKFPTDNGGIGLFLFSDEAATTPYEASGYSNVGYFYNATKAKWTAGSAIKAGEKPGYLYGYFPYREADTDVKAIPVSSSLNGDDMMYAARQASPITCQTASTTSITMSHALARVALKVIKGDYQGAAKLTEIIFSNEAGTQDGDKVKISSSGMLNAVDGSIAAARADTVLFTVPEADRQITAGGTLYECLIVPSAVDSTGQKVALTLTIDGERRSVSLSGDKGVAFISGVKSTVTITLCDAELSVSSVSITDWSDGSNTEADI